MRHKAGKMSGHQVIWPFNQHLLVAKSHLIKLSSGRYKSKKIAKEPAGI
jgi:hypothetical protein